MSSLENNSTEKNMHPAVHDMIERFGVTTECHDFLSQQQTMYIDGEFTLGQGHDRLDVLEPSTGELLSTITSATTGGQHETERTATPVIKVGRSR